MLAAQPESPVCSSAVPSEVEIREQSDPWCVTFEHQLDAAGVPSALPHREAWRARFALPESLYVGLSATGQPCYGCAVDLLPLRGLPGHFAYRVPRFGYGLDPGALNELLGALVRYAAERRNVVRISCELFAAGRPYVEPLTRVFQQRGFTPHRAPRRYLRTLRLNIPESTEQLFDTLPRTARRNLRLAWKSGLKLRTIDDPGMAPTLAAIERTTFQRTGASLYPNDWPELIQFARDHPKLVRIVGIFSDDDTSHPELLGFAAGFSHGDHVEYTRAGTVRRPGLQLSLGYPLVWELIQWAHTLGSSWFDFGGITTGSTKDGRDALGGISDFKRHFAGEEIEVGGEWQLVLLPFRSRLADAVSGIARAIRRLP